MSEKEILSVSAENAVNSVDMADYKSKIFEHMELDGAIVKMQVDSGASCNVLPPKFLPKDSVIDRTDVKLTTYSKACLKVRSTVLNLLLLRKITPHSLALYLRKRWD